MGQLMFELPAWTRNWTSPPDQAHVNYIVRSGLLDEAGVPFEVVPNDGFMTTVGYCNRSAPLMVDAVGNIGCPGFKTTPMLLHQYMRPGKMHKHFPNVCKEEGFPHSYKWKPHSKERLTLDGDEAR
jgi:hypothetical protein